MEDLISKLKFKTYKEFPLYAIISYQTEHKIDNTLPHPMATDGKVILINTELIEKNGLNNNADVMFMYLHEIKHLMFLHNKILQSLKLNPILYNLATDILINELTLKEIQPSFKLKNTIATKEKFSELTDYDILKLTSVEIYDILYKRYKENLEELNKIDKIISDIIKNNANKSISELSEEIFNNKEINEIINKLSKTPTEREIIKGAIKDEIIAKKIEQLSNDEKNKLIKKINDMLIQGYIIAKQKGEGIGEIEKYIEHLFKKVRDWKTLLREEIITEIKGDWTYSKVSDILQTLHIAGFKQIGNLPSLDNTFSIPKLIIAIDVSGSIEDDEYRQFLDEIYSIFKSVNISECEIVLWDYDIQKKFRMIGNYAKILEDIKNRKGYGGTRLKCVFEHYKNKQLNNTILIVLTDGYFDEIEVKDLKKFKKVVFVISKDGTTEYIPKSWNTKIIKIR
jgi:predicted metal-dependent peptidase